MSELTAKIVEAIQDKKGKNIISIDISNVDGTLFDTFVICNADSTTQIGAIADGIEEKVYNDLNEKVLRVEGKENAFWIIMDYGDTLIHIFQTEAREFYGLEELWSDCKITKYQSFE